MDTLGDKDSGVSVSPHWGQGEGGSEVPVFSPGGHGRGWVLASPSWGMDSAASLCHWGGDVVEPLCHSPRDVDMGKSFCPCVIFLACHSMGDGTGTWQGPCGMGTMHTVWFLCHSFVDMDAVGSVWHPLGTGTGDMDTAGSLCHPLGVSPP